jgi:hypothetical protein
MLGGCLLTISEEFTHKFTQTTKGWDPTELMEGSDESDEDMMDADTGFDLDSDDKGWWVVAKVLRMASSYLMDKATNKPPEAPNKVNTTTKNKCNNTHNNQAGWEFLLLLVHSWLFWLSLFDFVCA